MVFIGKLDNSLAERFLITQLPGHLADQFREFQILRPLFTESGGAKVCPEDVAGHGTGGVAVPIVIDRCDQDRHWKENRHVEVFNRFCDLVVKHYRESREVKYYADLLNLTPKHLCKVVKAASGGISSGEWIEQYVTAQAKRLIETRATQTLKETAYMLGFSEPTSFYRYFKRVTGMSAKQYRDSFHR